MPNFNINPEHICSVSCIRRESDYFVDKNNPTEAEIAKIIISGNRIISTGTKDHPQFTELREKLAANCCITIERGWWNGDRVLAKFTLNNDICFEPGDTFLSAGALDVAIRSKTIKTKRHQHKLPNP